MRKKNFQVTSVEDGQKYWVTRSCCVCGIITVRNPRDGELYVLVSRRGSGSPDEIGKYQFTCGYIDWGEHVVDAVKREIYEELGLDLSKISHIVKFLGYSDSIEGENEVKQNITFRFLIPLSDYNKLESLFKAGIINADTVSRGGEPNEIDNIKLIKIGTDMKKSDWAFNHYDLFKDLESKW